MAPPRLRLLGGGCKTGTERETGRKKHALSELRALSKIGSRSPPPALRQFASVITRFRYNSLPSQITPVAGNAEAVHSRYNSLAWQLASITIHFRSNSISLQLQFAPVTTDPLTFASATMRPRHSSFPLRFTPPDHPLNGRSNHPALSVYGPKTGAEGEIVEPLS